MPTLMQAVAWLISLSWSTSDFAPLIYIVHNRLSYRSFRARLSEKIEKTLNLLLEMANWWWSSAQQWTPSKKPIWLTWVQKGSGSASTSCCIPSVRLMSKFYLLLKRINDYKRCVVIKMLCIHWLNAESLHSKEGKPRYFYTQLVMKELRMLKGQTPDKNQWRHSSTQH